jgi:hypothetical protein
MGTRVSGPSDHELALLALNGKIGQWWESGTPQAVFAGSLELDGDDILLCLAIQSQSHDHPFSFERGPIAALCGLVDGNAVTLINCVVTNDNWNHRDDAGYSSRVSIQPVLILIGRHHADPQGKYALAGFSTNEIRKIFRVHPLKDIDPLRHVETIAMVDKARMPADELRRSRYALVELPNLNVFQAAIESINGFVSFQFSASHTFNRERGPSATYSPRLVMELQKPVSLYRMLRYARQATHLLSLISMSPNACLDLEVSLDVERPESWKVFQNGKPRAREPSDLPDWNVLVRFPKDEQFYPRLWSRWFATRDDHAVPRWMFQSSLEQGHRFDINRFLNVMQCLEVLASLYANGKVIDKAEFDKFCAIVEAEAQRHLQPDNLAIATRMLRQQNRPPLAMRLRSLVSRIDGAVLRWLLGDDLQAIDWAVKARNYFTHFGDLSAAKRELVEENLALLTCKMSALYVVLELDILGLPPATYMSEGRTAFPWMMRHAADRHLPPSA